MKKLLHMTLVLALLLGLSACAKGGDNDAPPLYGTYDVAALVEAGAFSEELEELDGDTAFMLYKLADYDLEREDLKDCAVQRSAGATCEEAAVLVFTSILENGSVVYAGGDRSSWAVEAFPDCDGEEHTFQENLLSRKQQIFPALSAVISEYMGG